MLHGRHLVAAQKPLQQSKILVPRVESQTSQLPVEMIRSAVPEQSSQDISHKHKKGRGKEDMEGTYRRPRGIHRCT